MDASSTESGPRNCSSSVWRDEKVSSILPSKRVDPDICRDVLSNFSKVRNSFFLSTDRIIRSLLCSWFLGLVVNYDLTVRDSDGSVVQFQYGEDSMDVCKSQYLKSGQLKFLQQNKKSVLDKRFVKIAQKNTDKEAVAKTKETFKDWQETYGSRKKKTSGFLKYCKSKKAKKLMKGNKLD